MSLRRSVQAGIRDVHLALMNRGLPDRLALYFHSLEEPDYPAFTELVEHFASRGYLFVTADRYGAVSGKSVFVSFDDNYRSWWRALPLFDRLSLEVTFYVNSLPFRDLATRDQIRDYFDRIGHEGERETLSVAELNDIARAGHVIGSHGRSHFLLTSLARDAARSEIRLGKSELEGMIGREVVHFSYPYGMRRHFDEELRRYCRQLGFETVANAIPGLQHAPFDPHRIQRSIWRLDRSRSFNVENVCIDGRLFHGLTGRSAVG